MDKHSNRTNIPPSSAGGAPDFDNGVLQQSRFEMEEMMSPTSIRGRGRGFPPTLMRGFKGGKFKRGYAQGVGYLRPVGVEAPRHCGPA